MWTRKGKEQITQIASMSFTNSFCSVYAHYKLLLCVRKDLHMTKGKIAAQCAHASIGAFRNAEKNNKALLEAWLRCGQPTIAVQVNNEEEMQEIEQKARSNGVLVNVVRDAGRTQVIAGSKTVLAIGPGKDEDIDRITKHLKLL